MFAVLSYFRRFKDRKNNPIIIIIEKKCLGVPYDLQIYAV